MTPEAVRPTVTVHVSSFNTAPATELCIRSLRRYAGYPFDLVVGDSGSTDGSLEMLRSFAERGWLTLEVDLEGMHAKWLDRWRAQCRTAYAVFVDSDVEFRGSGWLADLVETAMGTGAALVVAEMLGEIPNFIEPVGGKLVRLAARPASWLLLMDVERARALPAGFGFVAEPSDAVPEGLVAYDVGAALFGEVLRQGLGSVEMPRSYRRKFHHYGGLSWIPPEGRRGRKRRRDLRTVERRLRPLRAAEEKSEVPIARDTPGVTIR